MQLTIYNFLFYILIYNELCFVSIQSLNGHKKKYSIRDVNSFSFTMIDLNTTDDFQQIPKHFLAEEMIVRVHQNFVAKFHENREHFLPPGLFQNFTLLKKLYIYPHEMADIVHQQNKIVSNVNSRNESNNHFVLRSHSLQSIKSLEELFISKIGLTSIAKHALIDLANVVIIDFSKNKLKSFNLKLLENCCTNIKELYLGNNQLTNIFNEGLNNEIKLNNFEMISLEILDLHHNVIKNIDKTSFGDVLPILKELNLANNEISQIDSFSFSELPSLDKLFLESNHLSVLHKNMFYGLDKLTKLKLSQNNIKFIETNAFSELPSLKELFLNDNNLNDIEPGLFDGLNNVNSLDLSKNKIRLLEESSFRGLKGQPNSKSSNLYFLNLRSNEISLIMKNSFSGLDNLKELMLDHNKLTYFDPHETGMINNLKIHLHKNPWYCGCHILPLVTWLHSSSIDLTNHKLHDGYDYDTHVYYGHHYSTEAVCSTPKDMENIDLIKSFLFISHKCKANSNDVGNLMPTIWSILFVIYDLILIYF